MSLLEANNSYKMQDERRIWIGNLDARLTEFHLLKIAQKCGPIEKFDMLFHKAGPLVGQSRGYAFVTYRTVEATTNALQKLNGHYVGRKPLAVRLAKNVSNDEIEKPKHRIEIPALGTRPLPKFSKEEAIRVIEEKLKTLERGTDELQINASSATQTPIIQRYQYNKDREVNSSTSGQRTYTSRNNYGRHSSGPYNRNQRPKRR